MVEPQSDSPTQFRWYRLERETFLCQPNPEGLSSGLEHKWDVQMQKLDAKDNAVENSK